MVSLMISGNEVLKLSDTSGIRFLVVDFKTQGIDVIREQQLEEEAGILSEMEGEIKNSRLQKARRMIARYVRENYMYDISAQDMARFMNYSEAYFCKLFKQCFGRNFTACLTEYRIEVAKNKLRQPTISIKEIGKSVGYEDSNYFAKVFRRVTGQSPTEYREALFRQ